VKLAVRVDREVARLDLPDGRPAERVVELRTHPLTGDTCRILAAPFRPLRVPDLRVEYAATREGCPFCPEAVEEKTPRFSPAEFDAPKFAAGEARVFPNVLAYAGVCAVTVLTSEHFVALPELREEVLLNGFRAARSFFHASRDARPDLPVRLLHWNFMPPAGSSLLHPHQQPMVTASAPNRLRRLAEGSARYRAETGKNAWMDLIQAEAAAGERWVGETPRWSWIMESVPQGRYFELLAVHESKSDVIDLRDEDFEPLCTGLLRAFSYMESNGLWSFNLALMGLPDASDRFRCQARLVPRAFFPPAACADVHFDVIEAEPMLLRRPETVAGELRAFFPPG
jgi:galactose-1-phosphate uridylyltransferase